MEKQPQNNTETDWVFWFAWKHGGLNKDACNKALQEQAKKDTQLATARKILQMIADAVSRDEIEAVQSTVRSFLLDNGN